MVADSNSIMYCYCS